MHWDLLRCSNLTRQINDVVSHFKLQTIRGQHINRGLTCIPGVRQKMRLISFALVGINTISVYILIYIPLTCRSVPHSHCHSPNIITRRWSTITP